MDATNSCLAQTSCGVQLCYLGKSVVDEASVLVIFFVLHLPYGWSKK